MNAVCLVIDRLQAGFLGTYGNTWIETPALDRLAAESFVFDFALADSPQLDRLARSYWHGLHALCARPTPADRPTLAALLRSAGVVTALATDEPAMAKHPLAGDFDELIEIEPTWQPQVAENVEQTHLARSFVEAIAWLESARSPFLLWCHFAGLGTVWDAPLDLRRGLWAEGDPEPYAAAEPPDYLLAQQFDPDEALGVVQAYAGQVAALDACLGAFLEFLGSRPAGQETALIVTAPRGFPLGEHRRVGPCDDALYGELLHTPLLVRLPGGVGAGVRSPALVEPADLWATLLDVWDVRDRPAAPTAGSLLPLVREEAPALRDRLCVHGPGHQRAIRTPAWFLRGAEPPELYAKPDDRWEVNDVATRCREVVECLGDALTEFDQTVQFGRLSDLPPLSDVLVNGLE